MQYISTRGGTTPIGFQDAIMTGLARDGGLLLPTEIPQAATQLPTWQHLPYADLAFEIMRLYVDIPDPDLRDLVTRSYAVFRHPDITPIVSVNGIYLLELRAGDVRLTRKLVLQ